MSRGMATHRSPRATPALLLLLASCVAPEHAAPPVPPPSAPAPQPMPVAPPASDDWRDIPRTPGAWSWSAGAGARFASPDGAPLFAVRCDGAQRQVVLVRPGATRGADVVMAFTTSAGSFAYPGQGDGGAVTAQAAAADPNLDRIAFSRGRFIVAVTGTERLALPADPEIGRAIEDCRG